MKMLTLAASSAYLIVAASLTPAASEVLASHPRYELSKPIILVDAQCVPTCVSVRASCMSGCAPGSLGQTSQCVQGCSGALDPVTRGNCMSACSQGTLGKISQCEQACSSTYNSCISKCAPAVNSPKSYP